MATCCHSRYWAGFLPSGHAKHQLVGAQLRADLACPSLQMGSWGLSSSSDTGGRRSHAPPAVGHSVVKVPFHFLLASPRCYRIPLLCPPGCSACSSTGTWHFPSTLQLYDLCFRGKEESAHPIQLVACKEYCCYTPSSEATECSQCPPVSPVPQAWFALKRSQSHVNGKT